MAQLVIDPEFQTLIRPLNKAEHDQLEKNLKVDGCREPLVTWKGILLDGHNRYRICSALKIPYEIREMTFRGRKEAKVWIIRNQLGRRNLKPFQRAELVLHLKSLIAGHAKQNQIDRKGEQPGATPQNSVNLFSGPDEGISPVAPVDTQKELAKLADVSHDTIHRVEAILERAPADMVEDLRDGSLSINKAYKQLKPAIDRSMSQQKPKLEAGNSNLPAPRETIAALMRQLDKELSRPATMVCYVDVRRHLGELRAAVASTLGITPDELQDSGALKQQLRRRSQAHRDHADESAQTGNRHDQKTLGVGIERAHEAINSLMRIPKKDHFRYRAFEIVTDWIFNNEDDVQSQSIG